MLLLSIRCFVEVFVLTQSLHLSVYRYTHRADSGKVDEKDAAADFQFSSARRSPFYQKQKQNYTYEVSIWTKIYRFI